ncbi:hypothetical protein Cal7507_3473 [Calothrix sp. PCC 7507]|nr:hypothetical protein Cal7507_3473 [Calothrix sp. PCC 7507]
MIVDLFQLTDFINEMTFLPSKNNLNLVHQLKNI